MKTLKKSIISISLMAFVLFFLSCDKDNNEKLSSNTTTANDYTSLLSIMDLNDTDEATTGTVTKSAIESSFLPCFEVTVHKTDSGLFWPRSWTFSYEQEDCLSFFGNAKLGSIHITLTDFWKNEGSLRAITYEDFFLNGNQIEGTRTILNTGLNDMGNVSFERSFKNAKITKTDSTFMTWETNCDVEMIAGFDSFVFADDEYLVSGSANGVNFDGAQFTATISKALHYSKCSFFPISGVLTIEVEGESTIVIDYGDDECDNIATLTRDGESTEITLSNKY